MKTVIRLRRLGGDTHEHTWEAVRPLRIGRMPSLDVVLDDSSVSRAHAELAPTARGWVVRDLGSTNGTLLNTARLVPSQEMPVCQGDLLQCGTISLLVEAAAVGEECREAGVSGLVLRHSARHTLEEVTTLLAAGVAQAPADALLWLVRVGRNLGVGASLDDYLRSVLWEVAEAVGAGRGTIVLSGKKTRAVQTRVDLDCSGGSGLWPGIKPLVGPALSEGTALLYLAAPEGTGCRPGTPGSLICLPLRAAGETFGVLCLAREPDQPAFGEGDLLLAEGLALAAAGSIAGLASLFEKQEERIAQTLGVLADLTALRDAGACGRARRVMDYALLLAGDLELPEGDRPVLRSAALLCDLVKVGVSDLILRKGGPLTDAEVAQVRASVARTVALLESVPGLIPLAGVLRAYRERWDGKGYPHGLAAEAIPLPARILAVADAFDAMTTDRAYRPALSPGEAFAELQRGACSQFDPACVAALLRLRPRLEASLLEGRQVEGTLNREQLSRVLESLGRKGPPPRRAAPIPTRVGLPDTTPDQRLLA